jgi:pimeloyl-ACP methyl ester carboxylesterase
VYPRWLLLGLRTFFAVAGAVAPRAAGRVALRLFCTPRRHHRPAWEADLAKRGETFRIGPELAAHGWGSGPTVLLVHGWEGRGTQLGRFVEPLVDAGFRVVAFDGPAHGDSPGKHSDLIEAAEALRKVARELGPLAAVVGHSFGGAVTTLALERSLHTSAVVLISSPSSVHGVLERFCALAGIRGQATRAFREAIEARTRVRVEDVEIFERVSRLQVPALIVHDRDDREVPFHDGERLAGRWPAATLIATRGLGHRRILKDDAVIRGAVAFVRENAPLPL